MSHPPQNPKVQLELLAYLEGCKVSPDPKPLSFVKRGQSRALSASHSMTKASAAGDEAEGEARKPSPRRRAKSSPTFTEPKKDYIDIEEAAYKREFRSRAVGHNILLESKTPLELGELMIFHNKAARQKDATGLAPGSLQGPTESLKDLRASLLLSSFHRTVQLGQLGRSKRHAAVQLKAEIGPSRLLAMSEKVLTQGPSRLEFAAQAAQMSIATGEKLP